MGRSAHNASNNTSQPSSSHRFQFHSPAASLVQLPTIHQLRRYLAENNLLKSATQSITASQDRPPFSPAAPALSNTDTPRLSTLLDYQHSPSLRRSLVVWAVSFRHALETGVSRLNSEDSSTAVKERYGFVTEWFVGAEYRRIEVELSFAASTVMVERVLFVMRWGKELQVDFGPKLEWEG